MEKIDYEGIKNARISNYKNLKNFEASEDFRKYYYILMLILIWKRIYINIWFSKGF